jgi:hypothetical protein
MSKRVPLLLFTMLLINIAQLYLAIKAAASPHNPAMPFATSRTVFVAMQVFAY